MSVNDVKLFYEQLAKDQKLRKIFEEEESRLLNNYKSDPQDPDFKKAVEEKLLCLAKKSGYNFSMEDLNKYMNSKQELSDDMLDNVSGGLKSFCVFVGAGEGCACPVAGGGSRSGGRAGTGCGCVVVGAGEND